MVSALARTTKSIHAFTGERIFAIVAGSPIFTGLGVALILIVYAREVVGVRTAVSETSGHTEGLGDGNQQSQAGHYSAGNMLLHVRRGVSIWDSAIACPLKVLQHFGDGETVIVHLELDFKRVCSLHKSRSYV